MVDVKFACGLDKVAQPQNSSRWCTTDDEMTIVFFDELSNRPIKAYRWISIATHEVSREDLDAADALFKKHQKNLLIRTVDEGLTLGNKRQTEVNQGLTEDGRAVYLALQQRHKTTAV